MQPHMGKTSSDRWPVLCREVAAAFLPVLLGSLRTHSIAIPRAPHVVLLLIFHLHSSSLFTLTTGRELSNTTECTCTRGCSVSYVNVLTLLPPISLRQSFPYSLFRVFRMPMLEEEVTLDQTTLTFPWSPQHGEPIATQPITTASEPARAHRHVSGHLMRSA
jgi:hypothetical protein